MELIPSFTVDHTKLYPGIYVSRIDTIGAEKATTYDVRVTKPNDEPAVDVAAMHTLEHIIATFLRNEPAWKDEVIYWGPMGCLTGFYLILKGYRAPQEFFDLILRAFAAVEDTDEVPGAAPEQCGNYAMQNLPEAKRQAKKYVAYLSDNENNPAIFEYPKS